MNRLKRMIYDRLVQFGESDLKHTYILIRAKLCNREIILKGNRNLVPNLFNAFRLETFYLYKLCVTNKLSVWFRLISQDKISFLSLWHFEMCENVLICRKCQTSNVPTFPHQFLIRLSERKTGNLWKGVAWVCVCVCVCFRTSMMKRLS